ncbi:MAG: hypothetical protein UX31_C0003G0061 [Candidatus Nomurabacteria bacterium GW2011_GWA1_46_11]|uniref:TVP38/TMEM64 family membrane protein n=1 Tax=Candidatus Nomurabacteria bacterium GW2011_GWA1_46_11 TaxID=1618732 RepID=A0A0G1RN90_9BACT|nr:MAG: hypothetical protein UW73_C0004G0059 [Microgenomates group bacterium GW2011_GWB1_44_8]KKU22395.1 MAG: hypothetical protein UX31_C0003G0061 [Candidatus Nomurabacteria bacterium GW2011_GWA1_46_11]
MVVLGAMLTAIYFISNRLGTENIRQIVAGAGVFGPVIFIILLSLTYIIAPLSGTPFFFSGFALFGKAFVIYSYMAVLLGMTVNFWISRLWGRQVVTKLVGQENMKEIDAFTKNYGVKMLIFLRVAQGNLADFISYAYGLTNIKFVTYFLVSALTPIPWFLLWWFVLLPNIDSSKDFIITWGLAITPTILVSFFLILYYRHKRKPS